ncbi:M23 family metallopeptidase [Allobranchiibius sp. GilTou73]|uniref:M23 family metallopeptidase n=1 Tax=Allobranchiibius sp. GilTou73 TaxID=2904523 RepID=UPI001F357E9E|nr:M23 family metallopeptidase [Allobranchiibius sp. GilTou73]UIJ34459.1 M23 family metallopeptidase [Allobranchiibius sp. GilTou73]
MDLMLVLATVWSLLAGPAAVPAPTTGYVWPLDPRPSLVRGYDAPPQPWAAGHRGVDLLGRPGQPVLAAGDGVVLFRGAVAERGVLTVAHPNGWHTTYEPVTGGLAVGTQVRAGQQIATLTAVQSHRAPRACLHWGLLVAPDVYRDPLTLLRALVPILVPLTP